MFLDFSSKAFDWLSSFWDWEQFRHPGTIVVLIGVVIEVFVDLFKLPKDKQRQEKWKLWGGIILVIGLMIEIPDNATSWNEVGKSRKEAKQAADRASTIESNNLVLRSKVVSLEAKVQWRTITTNQIAMLRMFLGPLRPISNKPISVAVNLLWGDPEVSSYADDITQALTDCGIAAEEGSIAAIRPEPGKTIPTGLFLVHNETNQIMTPEVIEIYNSLKAAEIPFESVVGPEHDGYDVTIFVGRKPKP
jgi:hypothetical protein